MVYYLEEPYGHLMLESMEGAQARTKTRGNLFSFSMPWEDIEKRCLETDNNWQRATEAARRTVGLPHDEEVLATLLNVHIVGGSKDLVDHLQGAAMRTSVVRCLIGELRRSGYPVYLSEVNSDDAVRQRMVDMYESKYGTGPFIPDKLREAAAQAHRAKLTGTSLVFDKNATPAEPMAELGTLESTLRPLNLVAQRSSKGASMVHEEHGSVLARYQAVEIQTGSSMMDQFHPQYLGLAHPFTLPVAVGGYDIPGRKERWRRPLQAQLTPSATPGSGGLRLENAYFKAQQQVEPARVKLFDITRGLPSRVEAQYRRHWSFVPGLWNLYFREQVKLGVSLSAVSRGKGAAPQDVVEQDAAMAAADLYEKLQTGHYLTQEGKRRRIDGDMSKLRFATGITPRQRRLLSDYNFRARQVQGTQEIRSKIGHICFWGTVVYGNGIFMTVSPGERHNYLAIRLSRYRARDPYIACTPENSGEAHWIGAQMPSLEASSDDFFDIHVPGYDLRRLIQARDPLAPALAFATQIRVQLAVLFGIRMCPDCPHCAESDLPCQDAFGSNAEAMGGLAGRSDGLCGAVECQKVSS